MKWELKELENAVCKAHGDQYANAIHEPLQSFSCKSSMAYFHAYEAEQIPKDAIAATPGIDDHDPPSFVTAMAVIFAGAPDDAGQVLRLARFKAEAHIIFSAQALHSLCDFLIRIQLETTIVSIVNGLTISCFRKTNLYDSSLWLWATL